MNSKAFQNHPRFIENLITAFANLTGILICVTLLFTVLSDLYPSNSSLFELTGRIALFLALVGCVLAAVSARVHSSSGIDQGITSHNGPYLVTSNMLSVVITVIIIGLHNELYLYEMVFIFVLGVALSILTFVYTLPMSTSNIRNNNQPEVSYRIFATIASLFVVGILIRKMWPANIFIDLVIASIQMLFIPGLSLTIGLLPSKNWIERFAYASPLSLSSQFIALVWLDWLGITVKISTIYIVSGVLTLLGFVISMYRTYLIAAKFHDKD